MTFSAGSAVGSFQIVRLLGSGGFADVYLARHAILDQLVALKVVRHPTAEPSEQAGARLMCRLNHPNVVKVLSADRIDGHLVIAMDFVDGRPLRELIETAGGISEPEVARIGAALADALDYLHYFEHDGAVGLAHLDVKPNNVIVASDGTVKLADFGVARIVSDDREEPQPTAGSPAYMAPEQYSGDGGPASDVWALGALLAEMLTREPLVRAADREGYRDLVLSGTVRDILVHRNLSEQWLAVIGDCLLVDPGLRPAAKVVAAQLRAWTGGSESRKCPECSAILPEGQTWCPECTSADAPGPPAVRGSGRGMASVSESRGRPVGRVAWAVLIATVVTAAGFGGCEWHRGVVDAAAVEAEAARPELPLAQRADALRAGLARVPVWARARVSLALDRIVGQQRRWDRIRSLEQSLEGAYEDRVRALQEFSAANPSTPEGIQAAARVTVWQHEAGMYEDARAAEERPAARISDVLAAWTSFVERQQTGFRQQEATARQAFWRRELGTYDGMAELTVVGARGLPPMDTELVGQGLPDPYFVLLVDGHVVYQSLTLSDTPTPAWNESARVHITPSTTLAVELRDRDPIRWDVISRVDLGKLPPDGQFIVSSGGIEIDLAVRREK